MLLEIPNTEKSTTTGAGRLTKMILPGLSLSLLILKKTMIRIKVAIKIAAVVSAIYFFLDFFLGADLPSLKALAFARASAFGSSFGLGAAGLALTPAGVS